MFFVFLISHKIHIVTWNIFIQKHMQKSREDALYRISHSPVSTALRRFRIGFFSKNREQSLCQAPMEQFGCDCPELCGYPGSAGRSASITRCSLYPYDVGLTSKIAVAFNTIAAFSLVALWCTGYFGVEQNHSASCADAPQSAINASAAAFRKSLNAYL